MTIHYDVSTILDLEDPQFPPGMVVKHRNRAACGAKLGLYEPPRTKNPRLVTCGKCMRTKRYKRDLSLIIVSEQASGEFI